jgi:hypothetical protein
MPHRQMMRAIELMGTVVASAVRKALGSGPKAQPAAGAVTEA